MPGPYEYSQNHLLAALPPSERERIYPYLELIPMPLGKVLYESGDVLHHVFFPLDSIVSLLYVMEDGASAEISVVGNEGLIGVALFMGGETTPSRAIVQSAGYAYRLVGQRLKDEFHRNGELQQLLLRYTQALLTQMAQTAVCNRHHSVNQQLCRWLLLSLDRLPSNQLTMTQELIANMLGVRREGVTDERIFLTGNVMIDTLVRHREASARSSVLLDLGLQAEGAEPFGLMDPSEEEQAALQAPASRSGEGLIVRIARMNPAQRVQAAEEMLARDPERARRPLSAVQETGRTALTELPPRPAVPRRRRHRTRLRPPRRTMSGSTSLHPGSPARSGPAGSRRPSRAGRSRS